MSDDTRRLGEAVHRAVDERTAGSPHDYDGRTIRFTPGFPHGEVTALLICAACEATAELTGPQAQSGPLRAEPWPWVLTEQREDCPAASASSSPEAKAAFHAGYRSGLEEAARRTAEFMKTFSGSAES